MMAPKEIIGMWIRQQKEMWSEWKTPQFWLAWTVSIVITYLIFKLNR